MSGPSRGWAAGAGLPHLCTVPVPRFNVNTGVVDKRYFQGLPSPAAAALVAGFIWLMTELGVHPGEDAWLSWSQITWVMFAFTLYSGLTMVTNRRNHPGNRHWSMLAVQGVTMLAAGICLAHGLYLLNRNGPVMEPILMVMVALLDSVSVPS